MARRIPAAQGRPVAGAASELRVRLLGHVAVELDGRPFKLATPRKTLPILAYLLLHRDAPVARDFLAYAMWPDEEEDSARSKLRMSLYELGRILPPELEALVVTTDSVRLRPDLQLWLDVEEFDRLIGDPDRVGEALALYRGDLLASLYDEWILPERERRRNLFLAGLSRLVSEARRDRDFQRGIERAQQILALDPWREDIVRQLMALRCESGDRAGALAEYERFAKLVRLELGVDPMPETVTVREAIARGEAIEDEADAERVTSAMLARSGTLPFVGRRPELERLLETWSRAARGRGSCVFVGGEPGVGKSRLAVELAHAVEERGGRILLGTTGSPEAIPYESIADALRSALPLVASLKATIWLACVAALLPELRARVATLPNVPRIDAESDRIRLFESIFRCLADLAAPRPVLLILEDLHWAQPASIALVHFLLQRITAVPLMVVATYRDDETPRPHPLHRLRQETRAAGCAQSLSLRSLSITDVEQLAQAMPEIVQLPAGALLATSAGNPLFLTQLVDDYRKGGEIVPPQSLQILVARRIERLSPEARTAAEIAAGIGTQFSRDALREVSGWDESALGSALDELLDGRIVRETSGRGLFEYAFAHHVLYEAIARAAPPERAAARQRRIARVLEELYPDWASELSAAIALHYERAGDGTNAARCYLTAVRRSMALGALDEARSQCERALAVATDPRQRVELLLESEAIESLRGSGERWRAALSALAASAEQLDDPDLQRTVLMRRIEFTLNTNDRATSEALIAELQTRAQEGDAAWKVALHVAEAKLAFALGQLAESDAAAQAALACSREAGDDAGIAQALRCLANVEAHRGRLAEAEAFLDESGRAAAHANDPILEREFFWSGCMIAYQRRDIHRCITLGTRFLGRAAEWGDRRGEAQAHSRLALALALTAERVAEAREHYAAAAAIFSACGNVSSTAGELMNQAVMETRLGFFDRACSATEKAIALFDSVNDARGRVTAMSNLGLLRAYAGDAEGGQQAAREALVLAQRLGFGLIEASAFENLAYAQAAAGDLRGAIEHAEASLEVRVRSQSEVWSVRTLADLAVWHAAAGNLNTARDYVRRVLANEKVIPTGSEWPEYCYWAAAQVFRLENNQPMAARLLARAQQMRRAFADKLEGEDRERFMALPWERDIADAAERDVWPNPPR